jgi:hypothetical protein
LWKVALFPLLSGVGGQNSLRRVSQLWVLVVQLPDLALRVCFPYVLYGVKGRLMPFTGRLTIADQLALINA